LQANAVRKGPRSLGGKGDWVKGLGGQVTRLWAPAEGAVVVFFHPGGVKRKPGYRVGGCGLRRRMSPTGGRTMALSHSAPPFARPRSGAATSGGGGAMKGPCRSANRPAACAKVQRLKPKSQRGIRWLGDTGTTSRVEGVGLRDAETPGHRWPRRGSADETRRMGAWVFMAPTCCAAPFPALKPNPSRSFLSAGRGDYPKQPKLIQGIQSLKFA